MKLLLCFILLSVLSVSGSIFSQNATFNLTINGKTVKEAFKDIESQSQYRFLYNDDFSGLKRIVSLDVTDASINSLLGVLLDEANLTYRELESNLIVITPLNLEFQERQVVGTLRDANTGEALPGASVVLQGAAIGTVTNLDGNYSITVPNEDAVLVFSFVGYQSVTRVVSDLTEINVDLLPSIHSLDEIVVIGYGVQRKALSTGATTNIRSDDLVGLRTTSVVEALQGQTPGMQIIAQTGQPAGRGMRVIVRGLGTIGESSPLYLVDGVQVSDIEHINVNDIEGVDILKDAASAAIYGSQAANGVVIITTKTGREGPPRVTFDMYYGVNAVAKNITPLNKPQYMMIMNEAATNIGNVPYFTQQEIDSADDGVNWVDEMYYDRPITQNYNLGLSGGSGTSSYSLSLGYTGDEGIIGGPEYSNYDRYHLRLNSDHQVNDWIFVGQRLNFNYRTHRGIIDAGSRNNRFRDAIQTTPILPFYDDNGDYFANLAGTIVNGQPWDVWYEDEYHPYAKMVYEEQQESNYQDLLMGLNARFTPFAGFSFETSFGFDYNSAEMRGYRPVFHISWDQLNERDRAEQSLSKNYSWILDNVASYVFGVDNHAFTILAGMSSQAMNIGTMLNAQNSDLFLTGYEYSYISNATNNNAAFYSFGGGPFTENRLVSYFGRINYNFKEKYLLNATYRIDGSSRFAKENRWGYFPSVSFGWIMTEEPFMENVGWLDFFKPRVSWGQVGNQNIPAFLYLAPVRVNHRNDNAYFGTELYTTDFVTGASAYRLGNPDLKWETSEQTNIGFDAYLLNTRLGVNVDWYRKTTIDWIIAPPVLQTFGTGAPSVNGGDVQNQGIELGMTWRDRVSNDFTYRINANFTTNKNEVINVPTADGIIHGNPGTLYDNNAAYYRQAEVGYPIGYFWGWKTDGIFQNENEVLAHVNSQGIVIQPTAQPGDVRYVDVDDSGSINLDDKTMIGNPWPKYLFGFTMGFDYKGFDFSVTASGVAGNDIIQVYRNHARGKPNYTTAILDRWHGEGTSNTIPRITEENINYGISDLLLHKGDYLRINNLTFGYELGSAFNQSFLSRLRMYGTISNLFTFTGYNGSDPEIGFSPQSATAGTDTGYYPRPRTFMIGFNVEL